MRATDRRGLSRVLGQWEKMWQLGDGFWSPAGSQVPGGHCCFPWESADDHKIDGFSSCRMMPPRLSGSPAELEDMEMHCATNTMFHKRRRRRYHWLLQMAGSPGLTLLLLLLLVLCAAASATITASSPASADDTGVSAPDLSAATAISAFSFSPCSPQQWWDSQRDRCTACTRCQGEMIPLRPCQLHTDTICGSIYDLKIDWVVLAKTEPNWKEVSGTLGARLLTPTYPDLLPCSAESPPSTSTSSTTTLPRCSI